MDKTIRAEEAAYDGFRQLAKEYELSNPELLAAMVQYFRVTKADPRHPTGPDLTSSLAKITAKLADLDKRTIGFIREQEKQYLKPILAEVQAIHTVTTAPAELTPDQLTDMDNWLTAVCRKGFRPEFQHPKQAGAAVPTYNSPTSLEPLRGLIRRVLGRELHPNQFRSPASATVAPAPAGSGGPPSPPPTKPV